MPSNRTKYSEEMREQTAQYILESGKSATSVAEDMGIDTNTVCRWVREYRRKYNMPSYAEEKGLEKQKARSVNNETFKRKELERKLKQKEKELLEEREKVEILKKSLHIFMGQSV